MRVFYLQHVPDEDLGNLKAWFQDQGHALTGRHLYRGDSLPRLDEFDWLVLLGGPMSVHDESDHAWLAPEKALLREAIEAGKRLLGICLGSQLIADALGGEVKGNGCQEIGWFPVTRQAETAAGPFGDLWPEQLLAFHWHGDTFSLPSGAIRLASSDACRNQAFFWGDRVLALQFHPEVTPELVRTIIEAGGSDIDGSRYTQQPAQMLDQPARFQALAAFGHRLLSRFQELGREPAP